MGLGTIHVQTASGSSSSEMAIVGLTEYENLRDFLYSRMRGARFGDDDDGAEADIEPDDEVLALLTEIRDEIRALRDQREGAAP